jgi:hypothetical protein
MKDEDYTLPWSRLNKHYFLSVLLLYLSLSFLPRISWNQCQSNPRHRYRSMRCYKEILNLVDKRTTAHRTIYFSSIRQTILEMSRRQWMLWCPIRSTSGGHSTVSWEVPLHILELNLDSESLRNLCSSILLPCPSGPKNYNQFMWEIKKNTIITVGTTLYWWECS